MSITSLNQSTARSQRDYSIKSQPQYRRDGATNAYFGLDEAVYNHTAKWMGYRGGTPAVSADGVVHTVDSINGFRGIPVGSTVTLRISKGFKTADFS